MCSSDLILPGTSPCGRTNTRIRGWLGRADQTTKVRAMFVTPKQVAEVVRRHPEIMEAVEACYREGAQVAAMTGSGSAVFGLFSEKVAPTAARKLQRPDWWVAVTRTLNRREASRRIGL